MAALRQATADRAAHAKWLHAARNLTLLAPIPRPAKNVFCVGRNYLGHIEEGARARGEAIDLPKYPQIFTKPPTAVRPRCRCAA